MEERTFEKYSLEPVEGSTSKANKKCMQQWNNNNNNNNNNIINHLFDPKCNITIQNKFHYDSYDWESLINLQW